MQLDQRAVMDAAFNNNIAETAISLDVLKLFEREQCPNFTSTHKSITALLLNSVSASAARGNLNPKFALEIIDRTAAMVELYPFVHLVLMVTGFQTRDFNIIPKPIKDALQVRLCTPRIEQAIEEMNAEALKTLLVYYDADMVPKSHYKFTIPIIRHIYEEKIIPDYLIFAFMASNLRMATDEIMNRYINSLCEEYEEDSYE